MGGNLDQCEALKGSCSLCEALIASTAILNENRSQFPDFDVTRFQADFEACLRAHCAGVAITDLK